MLRHTGFGERRDSRGIQIYTALYIVIKMKETKCSVKKTASSPEKIALCITLC